MPVPRLTNELKRAVSGCEEVFRRVDMYLLPAASLGRLIIK